MGATQSALHLSGPFVRFATWTQGDAARLLADYRARDLDFGVDAITLATLLGDDSALAGDIVAAFNTGSRIINALSFISAVAVVGEGSAAEKLDFVFSAFDFGGNDVVTLDELVILLLSVLSGVSVMAGSSTRPTDEGLERIATEAFRSLDRDVNSNLSRQQFVGWATGFVTPEDEPATLQGVLERFGVPLTVPAAATPDDAAPAMEFPAFPTNCKSLLSKHLTREVFEQLKDRRTALGTSLWDCVRSGVENLDSGVGVYAGDTEAYTLFAPLFEPLMAEYHAGFSADTVQPRDLDPAHLDAPNPDVDGEFIISTRIRVARNLAGMPLTPKLTPDQRATVESKVCEALNSLQGDLAGTYYPLGTMDESTRQRLVEDHFLFKKGDRFLESAGINGDWPNNRGIFHNNDKTFLVWVNEEDQLRIISMQPGGDIGAVFERLCRAVNALDAVCAFEFSDHLGFLSACPTNLGTGMRASVHIKLPLASADEAQFHAICDQYGIQPRGIHGEHSETTGGVYDISNKRRLGLSEVECVQDMFNGVQALIELERSLGGGDSKVDESQFPDFGEGCTSLVSKHLTREVFEQLKDRRTALGTSLWDCIRSGVENLDSGVGVYAGDTEAYTLFAPLFEPLMAEYHAGFSADTVQPRDLDPAHLEAPNPDADGEFIISTRIRVARNLAGMPLTPKLTPEQRATVESKVCEALNSLQGDLAGTYYPLGTMDESTRQRLVEDHFLFKKGDRYLESAGINGDWPNNRGIFHNEDKTFLVWVNEEDQLRIISMQPGGDIGAVFERLCRAVNALDAVCAFEFSDHLGFLSACPTNLGTGMRASVHIKLPLASADPRFQEICDQYGIQPRGIHGEHSETTGGVYDISNKRRLGLSEVQCVQDMYNGVQALIELERSLSSASS